MKNINKLLACLLAVVLLVACNSNKAPEVADEPAPEAIPAEEADSVEKDGDAVSVVTNTFPAYDWVKNITEGTDVEVTNLTDNGVSLHNYEPSAQDIEKIAKANLFLYVSGESDEWAPDAAKQAPNAKVLNMLEILGDAVKEEEVKEGMEHEHEHEHGDEDHDHEDGDEDHDHEDADHDDHDHDHDHEHDHEHEEVEYDEHVWLSVKNAKTISKAIADALCEIDAKNADTFKKNYEAYAAKLDALQNDFDEMRKAAKQDTILVADRFPFRYLVSDLDLDYFAAFVGCSAESEASFETISFLAQKVDELNIKHIIKLAGSDGKIADTVKNASKAKDQDIIEMTSMENASSNDGKTYIDYMQMNLDALKKALN
ncbi:metal ABC transporter substrate-binding protein [Fenollaria timonensis]|uniref:metal ABC transporter substrate-binding protein n=1 Tax=Fenollaria timonensis TaxID=1723384 RepID=UPI0026EC81E6|nr:metal ABC transporter substrate-binding protein [Fenollaria timonensis]